MLLNLWLGDPAAGQHGLLSLAGEQAAFRANVDTASEVVRRLGGTIVNSHYGNVAPGADPLDLDQAAIANLAFAAERIAAAGATLVLEALSPHDFPRYGVHHAREAVGLIRGGRERTSAPIGLLYDVYHAVRAGEDPLVGIPALAPEIAHVQVADVPGRGRPGTGAIRFERIFAVLAGVGYGGFVGLEHRPSVDDSDTFAWLAATTTAGGGLGAPAPIDRDQAGA